MGGPDDEGRRVYSSVTQCSSAPWKPRGSRGYYVGESAASCYGSTSPLASLPPASSSWAPRYSYQSSHAEVGDGQL